MTVDNSSHLARIFVYDTMSGKQHQLVVSWGNATAVIPIITQTSCDLVFSAVTLDVSGNFSEL